MMYRRPYEMCLKISRKTPKTAMRSSGKWWGTNGWNGRCMSEFSTSTGAQVIGSIRPPNLTTLGPDEIPIGSAWWVAWVSFRGSCHEEGPEYELALRQNVLNTCGLWNLTSVNWWHRMTSLAPHLMWVMFQYSLSWSHFSGECTDNAQSVDQCNTHIST